MSFDSLEYKTTSESAESVKAGAINLDEAQGIVECFVSGIGNKDSVGDIVATGAFTKSLMRRKPRVVWGHNWNDPIGKVLEIYEVGSNDPRLPLKMKLAGIGGLFAKVQFNLHSEKGREAFANVAFFGEEQEWSIGYKTLRAQYDQKSQANIIYELELYEVSPVLHGANQLTGTISVKADDPYAMDPMYGPATTTMKPKPEPQSDAMTMVKMMESQLSEMLGGKVSIVEMDDQNVTYAKPGTNGAMQKFKCPYMRDGERFMFGAPKPVAMPMMPMATPMPMTGAPGMPSAPMPPNDPRRIIRPQQMPSIPVAIKPGTNGMMMVPLPPVQYENQEPLPEADKNNLDKEEADLRDALLKIVKRHGRFNEDREGVWAGYKPAAENYVAKIGVKCANCVFYKGGGNCEIIAMPVEPEGKCRFAVIPKGVVTVDITGKKQYEAEYDAEQDKYVEDLEEKYPGELMVAALRGVLKRGRKKRRKYALLSDFGSKEDTGNGPYVIPVAPTDAFSVKQALDPIFDYYKADTFVDVDGIVVSSGASYEMIEAVDTAIENIKKKVLGSPEGKAVGFRIGRAIGSRLIDRPSIGGNRKRRGGRDRDIDLPTGGNPGSRRPTGSNFDPDRDGWVDEGTTRPRFIGVPTDTQKLQSGTPGKPEKRSVADRLARGINPERHGLPGEDATLLDPKESEKRKTFDQVARNWLDSGMGWMDKPRENGDTTNSPDFLRGRELGTNQARLSWTGARRSNVRRPNGFNENDKSSEEYLDWYASHANRMGAYLSGMRLSSGRDNNRRLSPEEMRGIEDAVINNLIDKKPDIDPDSDENNFLGRWLDANGFDGNLINADSAGARMSFNSGARVPNGPREGDGFNLDSPFGDPDEPFDSPTGDSDNFVDRVVRDFLDQADIGSRQDDYMAERDEERRGGLASGSRRRQRNWEGAPIPEPPTDEELEAEYQDVRRREKLGEVFDLTQPITKEKEALKRHIARQRARTDLSRREREYYEILEAVADDQGINPSQRKILVDDFFKRSFPDDTLEAVPDFTTEEYDVVAREVLDADELDRHLAMEADRVNPPLSDEEIEAQLDAQYQDYLKTPEGRIYLDGESARLDGENKLSSGYRSYANTPEQRRTPRQVAKYEGHVRAALSSGSKKKPDVDANGRGELITKDSPRLKEIYDKFAEEVIAAIEKAIQDPSNPNWQIPWRTTAAPRNPTTGRPYTGVRYNLVLLNALKANRGYPTAKWAGRVQWENRNRLLRGDRKAQLEFDEARGVDILVPEVKNGVKTGNFYVQRIYNVADVKGLPEKEYLPDDPVNPDQAVKEIDQIVNNEIKPKIYIGSTQEAARLFAGVPRWEDRAFYSPSHDAIHIPEFGSFKDAIAYYTTLFHETTHWTGHKSRNDRSESEMAQYGSAEYAYEELIAEIGASQALSLIGLTLGPREDHVQYLKGWLSALRNDPDMLRRAVDEAQEAVDAMLELSPTMRRYFGIQEGEIRARRDAFRKRKVGAELPIGEGMEGSERIKDGGKKPKMPTTGPVSGYPTEFLSSGRRLTPGQRDSLRSHANGLDIDERNIYEPFGKSQRSRDGRVYDVTNRLSSGSRKITSADGKTEIQQMPADVSAREVFDLSFDPTERQRDITDAVLANVFGIVDRDSKVISVSAGAGSGKTTTLKTVMKAIGRLFDFGHLTDNPAGRKQKIDYLDTFFPEIVRNGIAQAGISKKTKLSELDNSEFAKAIEVLQNLAKSKKGFYVVFGKANQEDAEVEFPSNTAVSTLDKLAWWSLRLGAGEEGKVGEGGLVLGRGMRKKLQLAMLQRQGHPKRKDGTKLKVIRKKADGTTGEFEGFNPGWRELGYTVLENGFSVRDYLDLDNNFPFAASTSKGGEQSPLSPTQAGHILWKALNNFMISGDPEPSAKHFRNTKVQDEQLQHKINLGVPIPASDLSYEEVNDEAIKALQKLWADIKDENSSLLPHQSAIVKLWSLTNPSLSTGPGMISHASKVEVTLSPDGKLLGNAKTEAKKLFGGDDTDAIANALMGMTVNMSELSSKDQGGKYDGYVVVGATKLPNGQWRLRIAAPYGADPNDPASLMMIDEAQDMNEVVLGILDRNRESLPIVMVGDPRQAIMAWRGSMDILSAINGDFSLTLPESFRYGPRIAYAANIVLGMGNLDDEGLTGERSFAHVVGLADELIRKIFNFEGLSPDDFAKRLGHIQHMFQADIERLAKANPDLGLVPDKNGEYKLTDLMDRLKKSNDKTRKPLFDALTALQKDLIEQSRGDFIGPDEDVDAVLTRSNAGIVTAAVEYAASMISRGRSTDGKPATVVIPSTRWTEMVDFFRHMRYVTAKDKSKLTKPRPSKLIGNVWEKDTIENMAQMSQHGPLRSLMGLLSLVPSGRKDPIPAWQWLSLFKETRSEDIDPDTPIPVQFVMARKELGLSDLIDHPSGKEAEVTGSDLSAFARRTGLGTGAAKGKETSRGSAYDIIPDPNREGKNRVMYQLDLDEDTNQWTGKVHIRGTAALLPQGKKEGSVTRETQTGVGRYYDDIKDAVAKLEEIGLIKPGEVRYMTEVARAKGTKTDAWVIEGSGDSPEERAEKTALILSRIGTMVRRSAASQKGDVEIMTVTTAKGKEWDKVRLHDDFYSPPKPFNWDKATPDQREAQVRRTLDDLVPEGKTSKGRELPIKRKRIAALYGISEAELKSLGKDKKALREKLRPLIEDRLKTNKPTTVSASYREELNLVYVAITRAKRKLDPGASITGIYLSPETDADGEIAKAEQAIVDGIANIGPDGRPRISPEAAKPSDWRWPTAKKSDSGGKSNDGIVPIISIPDVDDPGEGGAKQPKPKKAGRPAKPTAEAEEEEETYTVDGGPSAVNDDIQPLGDTEDIDGILDDGEEGVSLSSGSRREPAPVAPRQSAAPGRTRTSQPQRTLASGAMARRRERGAGMPEPTSRLGGREGRRINRLSSGATGIRASDLAAINPSVINDEEKLSVARRFWRRFRETGLALDTGGAESGAERKQKIRRGMDAVGERIAKSNVVKVGNVADNDPQNATSETWMLPVDKLLETIRIPTSFDTERDEANTPLNVTPTQTRSITPSELGTMLGMSPQESRALGQPGAGISSDTARLLVAEIGSRPEFGAWRLFGRAEVESRTPQGQMQAFAENLRRSQLRDRFMIETFGEDAFPFWYDKEEGEFIGADDYRDLGEISERGKFIAVGSFTNRRNKQGQPIIQSDTSGLEPDIWADIDGTTQAIELDTPREASRARVRGSELRSSYSLDSLLDHLGIPRDSNWPDELRRRMQQSFGTEEVGLKNTNPTERRDWQSRGIPTGVVREMIRTGLIPDSATVWGDDSLDSALLRTTNNVYEAFNKFIDANWPGDRPITSRLRNQLAGATIDVTLPRAAAKQNKTWSVRNPNESLMEDDRMQAMVDRLNEALGTNFTIDDMFSDEQLRTASDDLSRGVTSVGRKTES